ncbi:uroporphyrinogen-III C-methyltransferase [Paraglaciecola aquimarina]|uniref:Uroporphyrinogen-III C-methyltransferase n=1 Tax=Paraglaciecola aquimarina TaxID=1235557 RepID=A0ABU3SU22_9ALTE|nr:uroporphyrinogen-III C-methyltransferase [Paraglaciecola aquimarina]MDU0353501.1 uroporphyrinogen-III C-methyltransferase [Paraglaciecola aquimarina]
MADSQDKLTPADQKKLAELEQQVAKDKSSDKAQSEQPSLATKKETVSKARAPDKPSQPTRTSNIASNSAQRKSSKEVKTGPLWFFTVINLLLLIGVFTAGYWLWMQWQTQNQQQKDMLVSQQNEVLGQQARIDQSLSKAEATENSLFKQNQALQTSMHSVIEQLQVTSEQVRVNRQNLADVSGRRPSDWLLAEADYLVRMAGRKLWLENDVKTAIMMLQSADTRLQDLDDPSLLPIRENLAVDMQTLQQVNQVSIDSIALSIGALAQQVDTLPLAFFKKPTIENEHSPTSEEGDWRSNLARNWQQVTQDFFSVKRKTAEIKPFMSDQEQWLSKEQLRFALLQAQVAVLRENEALFQQSLQAASDLSTEYFDVQQDVVQQFAERIAALQTTNIQRVYPEQFAAAPLLQDVIERRLDSRFITREPETTEAIQP